MTKFEWDARKAQLNLRKHRVSFEEAATVFLLDEFLSTSEDPDLLTERTDSSQLVFRQKEDC